MLKINRKACLPARQGFTWLEIIIIIAILIIIFFLAKFGINNAQVKSRDIERIASVKQIQNSLELYFYNRNQYPILENIILGSNDFKLLCDTDAGFQGDSAGCEKIYLEEIISAPQLSVEDVYIYNSTNGQNYIINFTLEKGVGGLGVGAHTATADGVQ